MRTRNWSIRSKIVALITIPLVALLALWIFATVLTAGPAFTLLSARTVLDDVGNPGIDLVGQLQRERVFTVEYLASTGEVPAELTQQRKVTDTAIAKFRRLATGDDARGAASDALRGRIDQFLAQLDSLAGDRTHVDRREVDAVGAQGIYNDVIGAGFDTFTATASFDDERIDRELRALTTVGHGQEYLSRIDSLIGAATTAGKMSAAERAEILQDVGTARFLLDAGSGDMSATDRTEYQLLGGDDVFTKLGKMMDTLVAQGKAGAAPPVSSATWRPTFTEASRQLRLFEVKATDDLTARVRPIAVGILLRLGLAGVLGLLAIGLSVFVSIKVGRSIVGRLGRMRAEAHEVATEKLPAVVRRLQRGEAVDVETETPSLEYGQDEIGELGHAFTEVQRTAVRSAVEEANVRRGINEVFLNIARRSQTLLHRQLSLLDKMERREAEPEELEDLYRVDHLATRMRRHAEDLVILAGAAPGRGWRNPVPVIDVIRGAISEVEDYRRVDIRTVESSAVLGRAVGDVIHLLAELLENAASFSPPQTQVQVTGQGLPNGYAIEIEDRGLGMSPEDLDESNRRLLEPPEFDPTDSARLGLFVVAQLAHRHNIRVSLRASAYGGLTAIVMIPGDLVVIVPGASPPPSRPAPVPAAVPPIQWHQAASPQSAVAVTVPPRGEEDLPSRTGGFPRRASDLPSRIGVDEELPNRTGDLPRRVDDLPGLAPEAPVPAPAADGDGLPHGGPTPSEVVTGLSEDGLVQRRRKARPAPPERVVDTPTIQFAAVEAAEAADPAATQVVGPAATPAAGSAAARVEPVGAPAEPEIAAAAPAVEKPTEDRIDDEAALAVLPRRVRQASLAPQLRERAPQPSAEAIATRTPEQVRNIMSAYQKGTTRGRIDAARYRPESLDDSLSAKDGDIKGETADKGAPVGADFASAATVSFPAIVTESIDGTETGGTETPAGSGGTGPVGEDAGERAGAGDVTRPEKEA